MRRRLLIYAWILFVVVILPVGAGWAAAGLSRISDGVYAYVDIKGGPPNNRFGANAGIIVGDDGVLVVDTLASAKEAAIFLKISVK